MTSRAASSRLTRLSLGLTGVLFHTCCCHASAPLAMMAPERRNTQTLAPRFALHCSPPQGVLCLCFYLFLVCFLASRLCASLEGVLFAFSPPLLALLSIFYLVLLPLVFITTRYVVYAVIYPLFSVLLPSLSFSSYWYKCLLFFPYDSLAS